VKYVYLANGRVGWEILRWLVERAQPPVALVVHAADKGKFRAEIIDASGLSPEHVFDAATLRTPGTVSEIKALRPDLGLSVLFGHILKREFLDIFPHGCLNLHPSFLPYNRGQYPNVWSIVEGTPSGVTMHYIDEEVDTGDIIAQKEVSVQPTDTGESLYRKLEEMSIDLFCTTWPSVVAGKAQRTPQKREAGTYHRTRDVDAIDKIDLDRQYTARHLINILRARTFPLHKGACLDVGGRKIYLSLELIEEKP